MYSVIQSFLSKYIFEIDMYDFIYIFLIKKTVLYIYV